jgi:hypothetical protein
MGALQGTFWPTADMPVDVFDRPHPSTSGRVVGVHIGDLTIQFRGTAERDADLAETTDMLIAALTKLRDRARERIGES